MAPADGAYSAADMASACPPAKLGGMQIYRSSLLRFADDGQALYDEDGLLAVAPDDRDRKSTRLNSSHTVISYAVFCLKKKKEEFWRHANLYMKCKDNFD